MSTATDSFTDLDVDFDAVVPCHYHGRPDVSMFGGWGFGPDAGRAGVCDDEGAVWLRIASCCGSRNLYCHAHYLRWNEGVKQFPDPSRVKHGPPPHPHDGADPSAGCMRFRDVRKDKWVRL
jgi:hypothetical protein